MQISFSAFFSEAAANPAFGFIALLTLAVILVNGWTDAPNAIASCVVTRCMKTKHAVCMAAVCNLLGVVVMTALSGKVAQTVFSLVGFEPSVAPAALAAAMCSITIWAVAAWIFGIPTSESHALLAGLTGAAVAASGFQSVNGAAWRAVLLGLVLSAILGFASGWGTARFVKRIFRNVDRSKAERFFGGAQIAGSAASAFMHGAQDGQKFISVLMLAAVMFVPQTAAGGVPFWMMLLCAAVMAAGTAIGGYRIIKSVGIDMVRLQKFQGFSADIASSACLLFSSLLGLPVSTTHTKTTAVMGVGAEHNARQVNWKKAGEMVLAWVLTFPGCGALGYLLTRLFLIF